LSAPLNGILIWDVAFQNSSRCAENNKKMIFHQAKNQYMSVPCHPSCQYPRHDTALVFVLCRHHPKIIMSYRALVRVKMWCFVWPTNNMVQVPALAAEGAPLPLPPLHLCSFPAFPSTSLGASPRHQPRPPQLMGQGGRNGHDKEPQLHLPSDVVGRHCHDKEQYPCLLPLITTSPP
jgi:hypothetical protein